jgi:hypothetical protein
MTALGFAQFGATLTTALAMVPALAHVMELPHKIRMSRVDYLITQRIYRGWNLVGIVVVAALAATIMLASLSQGEDVAPAWAAVTLIVLTQFVFWVFTFPVNRRTGNWSSAPDDWTILRRRWEFSHAVSACLNVAALICVLLAVIPR